MPGQLTGARHQQPEPPAPLAGSPLLSAAHSLLAFQLTLLFRPTGGQSITYEREINIKVSDFVKLIQEAKITVIGQGYNKLQPKQ